MKGGHQHITRGIKHSLASKNGLLNCFTTLRGTDIILSLQLIVKWLEDTGYWQNVWHDINSLVPMEYQKYQNGGHCMQLFQIFECKFSVQCDDNAMYHFQVFTPSEARRQQWRLLTRSNQSPEPRVLIDMVTV